MRGGPNQSRARTLTIFLLKEDALGRPIKEDAEITAHPVGNDGAGGILYVKPPQGRPPGWLSFFGNAVPTLNDQLLNSSSAAILVVERQNRRFAAAFGYGRHLLSPSCWEEDFGLRVTLNSVDRKLIRSVDRMSLDAIAQHSQIQASREADIDEFGLDLEQDLLRAVTGKPSDPELGKRLTGRDALQITANVSLDGLPALLDRLFAHWQREDYKRTFPWIDQIQEVKDTRKKADLDELLVERLRRRDQDRLWLTVPQIIDWAAVEGFKYKLTDSAIHDDVHVNEFGQSFGPIENVSTEELKHHYIYAIAHEGGHVAESWSVYRCLYCEIDQGEATYILTSGKWYKVGQAFLLRVSEAFDAIPRNSIPLPAYIDASEGDYNVRVANEQPGVYALMDKRSIRMGDRNQVEFCDLLKHGKKIVHVKRYSGSSAPLSHLCAQAVVSGTLFKREKSFRQRVNAELPAAFRPVTAMPNPGEYEVVFGIVSKSQNPLVLPLFSRINIKNACSRLQDLGFTVSLSKIQAIGRRPAH